MSIYKVANLFRARLNPHSTVEMEVTRGDEVFIVTVSGEIEPFVQGKCFGPPENCYPDEGGYANVEEAWTTVDGEKIPFNLTKEEEELAAELLYNEYQSNIEDDFQEPDDYPPDYDY